MKYKYDLVIFDLDGTLLDTSEGLLSSVEYMIEANGLRPLKKSDLLSFIGPPVQESIMRIYGYDKEEAQSLADQFRNRYKDYDLLKASPYDGIYDLMKDLRENGTAVAVATYKREDYALKLLKHYGFDRYAQVMHGGDDLNLLRKKDIIEICITESGVKNRQRVAYVGDTGSDLKAAEAAEVDFLGVNYGFGFKDVIGYADTPMDLLDKVRG